MTHQNTNKVSKTDHQRESGKEKRREGGRERGWRGEREREREHGRSPSAKSSHTVACGTGLPRCPSDNSRPVCREIAFFVLTILWPGNGLFTAENLDPAAIPSLI